MLQIVGKRDMQHIIRLQLAMIFAPHVLLIYCTPCTACTACTAALFVLQIIGQRDMQHIIRLQLALMKPGVSDIKIHVDSGGYAIRGHRIHIPVFTHPEVLHLLLCLIN
jgi:predicted nucleic acid-binding Zn finger protein